MLKFFKKEEISKCKTQGTIIRTKPRWDKYFLNLEKRHLNKQTNKKKNTPARRQWLFLH